MNGQSDERSDKNCDTIHYCGYHMEKIVYF
jgi:hypothetical protein